MTTFEELLAQAKRPGTSVSLCLRGDLTAPYRELERRLRTASREAPSLGQRSDAAVIAEQMRALETQMAEATTTFTLEALHPKTWSDFYNIRPQRGKEEAEEDWNVRWFGWVCQMVARSVTGPVVMTAEQVGQLCDVLSSGQWDELTDAAWGLNAEKITVPFSVAASALTPPSGQS